MKEMREHKNFWDKNAGRYDRFMRKDRAAYDEMYELIRPILLHKVVVTSGISVPEILVFSHRYHSSSR